MIFARKVNSIKNKELTNMDNQKIILITHEYPPKRGGAGVYCEELANARIKLGHPIEVWAPNYAIQEQHISKLPLHGSQNWTCSWKLFREIKKRRKHFTDNTILHFAEPGSLRAWIRFGWLLKNSPSFIITIHGTELIRFCKNPIERALFCKVLRQAKKIHVLSNYNHKKLLKVCPNITDKILLFPGSAPRKIIGDNKAKTENLINDKIQILCVGRIHPRKGQDQILSAINSLPTNLKDKIECSFAGPIVKKSFYDQLLIKSKSLGAKINFLGDINDEELKKYYQKSDIFALTSMPRSNSVEGFGFVYLEASSHGLPIIAHRIGGVEDAVKHGVTGILTNPQNQSELKSGLTKLIKDKDLRDKMGMEGKKWAHQNTWESLAKELYK